MYGLCAAHLILTQDEQAAVERLATHYERRDLADALKDYTSASRDADETNIEKARSHKKKQSIEFAKDVCELLESFCVIALLFLLPFSPLYVELMQAMSSDTTLLTAYESIPMQAHILMMRMAYSFFERNQDDKVLRTHVAGIDFGYPSRTFRQKLRGPSMLMKQTDDMTSYNFTTTLEAIRPYKVTGILPVDLGSEQLYYMYGSKVPEHY